MIVLGADMHKSSHTVAAIAAATGEVLDDKTAAVSARGFDQVVQWARALGGDRVWALEDCRHVSGSFERFLIARGERVVRVPTRLMANSRRSSRERGKSDRIDAIAVARAALAEGVQTLPTAELAGPELDIRLLVDHRERLDRQRVGLNNTLQWHLHDLWPELELPGHPPALSHRSPPRSTRLDFHPSRKAKLRPALSSAAGDESSTWAGSLCIYEPAEKRLTMTIVITAFERSPDGGKGLARDTRVRWALEEVGQPYEVRLVSFQAKNEPAHLRLHPFGLIPTYEEGDLALFETGAIVFHIAEHHAGLFPDDPNARARAITWMFAALNTVEPPILELVTAKITEGDKPWAEERLPLVKDRIRDRLVQLSARLGDADWLDEAFSAGDLMMVSVLLRLRASGLLDEFPKLAAYIARGEARPAYKRAFAAQLAVNRRR